MDTENEIITCPYCETEKEEGFLVDFAEANIFSSSWHPGKPEPGWIHDAKIDNSKLLSITAMRCPKCGHLDLFADYRSKKSKINSIFT